jgi:hypothetical protein
MGGCPGPSARVPPEAAAVIPVRSWLHPYVGAAVRLLRIAACAVALTLAAGCGGATDPPTTAEPAAGNAMTMPKAVASRGVDAGGDGRADVLSITESGRLVLWTMNGGQIADQADLGAVETGWRVVDAGGDYDGDGRTDILWRHADGMLSIWLMRGATRLSATSLGTVDDSWQVEDGRGDYDGDGRSDLLWRHTSGAVAIWRMDGASLAGASFPATAPPQWRIVDGSGDYDGDGRSDILWRSADGAVAIWRMNGGQIRQATFLPGVGPEWTAVDGSGDYDGDGRSDILWRSSTHPVVAWYMDGDLAGTAELGRAGPEWTVLDASGDYDGDGRSDVLWRNDDGLVLLWTVSGTARTSAVPVTTLGPGWVAGLGSGVRTGTVPDPDRLELAFAQVRTGVGSGFDGAAGDAGPPGTAPARPAVAAQRADGTWRLTWSRGDAADAPAYYQILVRRGVGEPLYPLLDGRIPAIRSRYAVSLPDDPRITYRVRACSGAAGLPSGTPDNGFHGCADSAQVGGAAEVGYLKAPVARPDARFGARLAISGDASRLAVAVFDDPRGSGVQVYRRSGRQWTTEAYLQPAGAGAGILLERAAMSADGSVLAVVSAVRGAADASAAARAVHVFVRNGQSWSQQARLVPSSGATADGVFLSGFALSGDGATLAVSGYSPSLPEPSVARAFVYVRAGEGWTEQALVAPQDQLIRFLSFGQVLALSYSGDVLAAAQGGNRSGFGAAGFVFGRSGGVWTQQVRVQGEPGPNAQFYANTVALSADGATLAVGAPRGDLRIGTAYLYRRSQAGWVLREQLGGATPGAAPRFGSSLALSADGRTLAVGSPSSGSDEREVLHVPTRSPDIVDYASRIRSGGRFGSGAVHLFRDTPAGWREAAHVKAPNADSDDGFGDSVELSSDGATLVVGAPGESSAGPPDDNTVRRAGAVYVF